MQREGVFREMKRRRFYEKPSDRANREQAEAIRRARKVARKKAQREGLIAAPPGKKKVPPGRPTGRGPFSVTGGVQRHRDGKVHLSRWDTMRGYLVPNASSVPSCR